MLQVADAPDGPVAVFAEKQAAVLRDGDSNRATPDFAVAAATAVTEDRRRPAFATRLRLGKHTCSVQFARGLMHRKRLMMDGATAYAHYGE